MKEAKSWLEKTQNFKNHRRVIKKNVSFFLLILLVCADGYAYSLSKTEILEFLF